MRRVFIRTKYVILACAIALAVFLLSVWAPSSFVIVEIITSVLPLAEKIEILSELLSSSLLELSAGTIAYIGTISLLVGVNIALMVFYVRMYRATPSSPTVGVGVTGILAALFGFGCAACGSIFIVSLAATVGGTGFIALLPYQGMEFGVLGMFLLCSSSYLLTRAINKPPVCPI